MIDLKEYPLMRTEPQFAAWLKRAKHGERCVYHIGVMADGSACRDAWDAQEGGLVHLCQAVYPDDQPKGHRPFAYIAERRAKKRAKP